MPRRRTFSPDILSFAHSDADIAPPSWLRSSSYAGSRGTASPSLSSCPVKADRPSGRGRRSRPAGPLLVADIFVALHALHRDLHPGQRRSVEIPIFGGLPQGVA